MSEHYKKLLRGVISALVILGAFGAVCFFVDKKDFDNVKASSTLVEATITDIKKERVSYYSNKGGGKKRTEYTAFADFTAPDGTVYKNAEIGKVEWFTKTGETIDLYIDNAAGEFYLSGKGFRWHSDRSLSTCDVSAASE